MHEMRYAIVIERAGANFSAYVPDLAGCVATASTQNEVETLLREAIELHIAGMREDNQPIPEPSSSVDYLEVEVAATAQASSELIHRLAGNKCAQHAPLQLAFIERRIFGA